MIISMPAIDANVVGDWTEQQRDLYQSLPFYLAKIQVDTRKTFPTFSKLVKSRKWKPNQGPILRGVRTNSSPNLRQFFLPNLMTQVPKVDVMDVRETTVEAQLMWHQFESPIFNFYPSFNDFMDHIDDNGKDIMEKIERANDIFIRTMMWHMAPYVLICNENGSVTKVDAPFYSGTGVFDPVNSGKTTAFLTANVNKPTGNLTMAAIEMAMTIADVDLRIPYFNGSELPKDDQPLDGKYLWVMDSEAWNQFVHDKYVQANRTLNFDIVTNGYRGSFFNRGTTRLEDLPMRYAIDGTFNAPELRVAAGELNAGETLPNSLYSDPANSPYAVAWLCGKNGYEAIDVGPPPSQFTGDTFPNSPKMDWNGVVRLTKNFLIPQLDANNNVVQTANTYGKYIKFISEATFGILPAQRRNAIPVIYLRKRGA